MSDAHAWLLQVVGLLTDDEAQNVRDVIESRLSCASLGRLFRQALARVDDTAEAQP